jgi:hypothetical protein
MKNCMKINENCMTGFPDLILISNGAGFEPRSTFREELGHNGLSMHSPKILMENRFYDQQKGVAM